jgi:uncharacterized protein
MAGRVLLIAAWVIVGGGIAGGAGYLHSLGPPPGPPDLSLPEAAPAPEAPPRLESAPAAAEAPHQPEEPAVEAAAAAAPVEPAAPAEDVPAETAHEPPAIETPRLPALAESLGEPAGTSAPPPAVESLDSLSGEPEAAEPATPLGDTLPSLAELADAADGAGEPAETFHPATDWPVITPELHGPMPMAERPAIDLAQLAEQGPGEASGEAAVEPETAPPPAIAEHPPGDVVPVLEAPDHAAAELEAPEPPPHQTPAEMSEPPPALAAVEPEVAPPGHGEAEAAEPEVATVAPEPLETVPPEEEHAAPPAVVEQPVPPVAQEPEGETVAAVVPPPAVEAPPADTPPADVPGNRPLVAVVVVGLGLSSGATEAAIQSLPAAVTLSFSPYSGRLPDWIALARAAGHEVLIDLPMEPADFPHSDPGPQALMTDLPADANLQRLDWVLSRGTDYVGVGSFMGSRFAADAAAMRPVLQAIADRGLIYLDSGQAIGNVAQALGAEIGLPLLVSDLQVDRMAARQTIDDELARIEALARENGAALAVGTAYPVTIERLAVWTRSLADHGIALVPASALVGH